MNGPVCRPAAVVPYCFSILLLLLLSSSLLTAPLLLMMLLLLRLSFLLVVAVWLGSSGASTAVTLSLLCVAGVNKCLRT